MSISCTIRRILGLSSLALLLAPFSSFQAAQAQDGGSWIDADPLVNWNEPGATIPTAPVPEWGVDERCIETTRSATTPEDNALVDAGWFLIGPVQIYEDATVVGATANFDGQCRPFAYQYFVFEDGILAGTLSPSLMAARSDGSGVNVFLTNDESLFLDFNRYTDEDPMCCPSGKSTVMFEIEDQDGSPLVVPTASYTENTASDQ